MFYVIINLKEFQSRFTHPAATCDPSAWRTRRQESPRFHRGLGSPPAPCCWQLWSHLSRGTDETCWNLKPNRVFQTSILHSFQPFWFIFGSRVEPVSPQQAGVSSRAAVNQPANADQVTRMKHSWLSARSRCGSATFRPTQAACKGTYHRTDTAVLRRWFGLNFSALWFRVGRSSRASKPSWTRCLSHR